MNTQPNLPKESDSTPPPKKKEEEKELKKDTLQKIQT